MKILAYPTPTNILNTIGEAPSFRPLGRTGAYEFQAQPNDPTPMSCVNRKAYNSRGYTGTRASKFIQDNQFLPVDRAPGVYPLSTPGTEGLGNVGDSAAQPRPGFAQPLNGDFQNILNILNKPDGGLGGSNMSAGQVRLLAERREKLTHKPEAGSTAGVQVATDFANTRKVMMKEQRIRNAEAQGFTREEAEKAYAKLRDREAEVALGTQESVASRFADLVDSRLGGVEDGQFQNNNESAKFLAYAGGKQEYRTVRETLFTAARSKQLRLERAQTGEAFGALQRRFRSGEFRTRTDVEASVMDLATRNFQQTALGNGVPSAAPVVRKYKPRVVPGLSVSQRPSEAEAPSAAAARIVEAVEKRRGRPPGAKDKAPRVRPFGITYKKGEAAKPEGGGGGGAGKKKTRD